MYLLDSLSNNDVTFFIPPYQRNYEWLTDNCKVLLSDVKKVAASNLTEVKTEHFFGSIVYVVEESGFGLPDKYVLTDGQQRITTTMLLLMALRDSIDDPSYRRQFRGATSKMIAPTAASSTRSSSNRSRPTGKPICSSFFDVMCPQL